MNAGSIERFSGSFKAARPPSHSGQEMGLSPVEATVEIQRSAYCHTWPLLSEQHRDLVMIK
jgi:hypothetical protein